MKKIALLVALIAPTLAEAEKSFLCLPKVSIGWTNNEDPFDIRRLDHQNKWVLQPIEVREIEFAFDLPADTLKANYSLTLLGSMDAWGFCNFRDNALMNACYQFMRPGDEKKSWDNKLSDTPMFSFGRDFNEYWSYNFIDTDKILFNSLSGIPKFGKPVLGLERGICEPF